MKRILIRILCVAMIATVIIATITGIVYVLFGAQGQQYDSKNKIGSGYPIFIKGRVTRICEEKSIMILLESGLIDIGEKNELRVIYERTEVVGLNTSGDIKEGDMVSAQIWGPGSLKKEKEVYELKTDKVGIYPKGEIGVARIEEIIDENTLKVYFTEDSSYFAEKIAIAKYSIYEIDGTYEEPYKAEVGKPVVGADIRILFHKEDVMETKDEVLIECERIVGVTTH